MQESLGDRSANAIDKGGFMHENRAFPLDYHVASPALVPIGTGAAAFPAINGC